MGFSDAVKLPPEAEQELPKGRMYHIACMVWFTASGKTMPLSFKFEGDDGQLITVKDISINHSGDKNYCGVPSKEYSCEAIIGGLIRAFRLIYYPESCLWVMVI